MASTGSVRNGNQDLVLVVYTTHGLTFPKGSSLKTKIVYGGVEWICSWMTDGIITINWEDYAQMKKMGCKNVYHINGVGVDTSRYHECQIDRETYYAIEKAKKFLYSTDTIKYIRKLKKKHTIAVTK